MLKKSSFALLILLSAVAPYLSYDNSSYAQEQAPNSGDISLIGVSMQFQSQGAGGGGRDFRLYGEIQNDFDYSIENIRMNATFFDIDKNELGTLAIRPYLDSLRPGERSPFDVSLYGAKNLEDFSYYSISKTWSVTPEGEAKKNLLDMNILNVSLDECGKYHISGTVGNLGRDSSTNTVVSGAFYNDKHQLVSTALTFAAEENDFTILPGYFKPFEIIIDQATLPHFAYYSLNAQSREYTSMIRNASSSHNPLPSLHDQTLEPGAQLTVYSDEQFYPTGTSAIGIHGTVSNHHESDEVLDNVLLTIIDAQGLVKDRFTAEVSANGEFAGQVSFFVEDSFAGQVFRIRAYYNEMIAENTFVIYTKSDHPCVINDNYIASVSQLNLQSDEFENRVLTDSAKVGLPVQLTMTANNKESRVQPITLVVEVLDEEGVARFVYITNSTLPPNGSADPISLEWTPSKTGMVTIKTFLLSDLNHPEILADLVKTTFRVRE